MNTTSDLSINHHFLQSLVHIQLGKFGKSFIPQILKVVKPLGKKLIYFSHWGFVIQKNYDSETSEYKLHSFRAFQRYLTDKNLTHG